MRWIIFILIFVVTESWAMPKLEWDDPTPMDDRISHYELSCSEGSLPVVFDKSNEVAKVDFTENSFEFTGELVAGKLYECAAYSWSDSYGIRSESSNAVNLDFRELPSPSNLRITITISISSE